MTRIRSLDVLPRLLAAAAAQTARLFNLADLAAPFQLSRPTIADYVALLERLFLLERLPAWHSNRLRRLVKAPKLHVGGHRASPPRCWARTPLRSRRTERCWDNFWKRSSSRSLRRQASWHEAPTHFFHFRDRDGAEVDVVIEQGARAVAGVEVKAGRYGEAGGLPRTAQAGRGGRRPLRPRRGALRRRSERALRRPPARGADSPAVGDAVTPAHDASAGRRVRRRDFHCVKILRLVSKLYEQDTHPSARIEALPALRSGSPEA